MSGVIYQDGFSRGPARPPGGECGDCDPDRDLVEKKYRTGQATLVRLNEAQNTLMATRGELAKIRGSLVPAREQLDY